MAPPGRIALAAAAAGLLLSAAPASADVYAFVDENGVSHFSNLPEDSRYKLFLKEPKQPAAAAASEEPKKRAAPVGRYREEIEHAARAHRLDPRLVQAVVETESGYNPRALSPKGAAGLMQLMPETARRFGVSDIFDVRQNLAGGARYLAELLQMFSNNLSLALAAYNAGEGAVQRHGNRIPPYAETRDYVPKVLKRYEALVRRGQIQS